MGKKCAEEFNPWPPFVDIFSSTILVLLLFMLILIVNIGYYAQFKFRVSYTGTVSSADLIREETPRKNKVDKIVKEKKDKVTDKKIEKVIEEEIVEVEKPKYLERVGQDLVTNENKKIPTQTTIEKDQTMVISFSDKEIIIADAVLKQIKDFISNLKNKYPNHRIVVTSVAPTNQLSATVGRQITLARTLNIRNMVRKLNYKKSDVRIKLSDDSIKKTLPANEAGYVIINAKVEK